MFERPLPPAITAPGAVGRAAAPRPARRHAASAPVATPAVSARSDRLAATLQRVNGKRGRSSALPPAKRPALDRHDYALAAFDEGGFAGTRTTKVSAILAPREVPHREKTPLAKAFETSVPPLGYDGGHVIGLHLGGHNTSKNVVPMYPRFNRGPWKALEDEIKSLAEQHDEELRMTVTMSYDGADPRVPRSFDVVVESDTERVHTATLRQPDDIPGIAALPHRIAEVLEDDSSYTRPVGPQPDIFLLGTSSFAALVAENAGHLPPSSKALYPDRPKDRPYGFLDILALNGALALPGQGTMGANREFSAAQREVLLQINAYRNDGELVSDDPDDPCPRLDPRGTANAPEVDHIVPKVLGGSNFYSNARVVSWQLNNREARVKPLADLVDVSRLAVPTLGGPVEHQAATVVEQWIARHPRQSSVATADIANWMQEMWPALGPEVLQSALWVAVLERFDRARIVRTQAAATVERRKVRARRAPTLMDV